MHWQSVTIIGVGLIGGSLGLALRRAGVADRIVGVGRDAKRLSEAVRRGLITQATTNLEEGVAEAELVVVCSPVDRIADHALRALRASPRRAVVTDVGSTKRSIVRAVERYGAQEARRFVGGHPIAGSEQRGAASARDDLFTCRTVVLTPTARTDPKAVLRIKRLWESVGARTVSMKAEQHDRILASTSHLPHLVAAALAAATPTRYLEFAGTGWADTTRIASGDVDLWVAIAMDNRKPLLRAIEKFQNQLERLRIALAGQDTRSLKSALRKGKKHRDALGS
ncbi:MAG: prephenate dehydrogenase [Pirellulaceae bacterium]|nr:MAG: prephenate dehydrogenase [Pirellulaceae bacterium]